MGFVMLVILLGILVGLVLGLIGVGGFVLVVFFLIWGMGWSLF